MADKAFLAGINKYAKIGHLRGCVNDTESVSSLLLDLFGFDKDNVEVISDSQVTKAELTRGWKWLLKGAKPKDRLVFHFSGHGSYTVDLDNEPEEADHRDELLCLYDMDWDDPSTYLLDDEIAKWAQDIPKGVNVTFILDCCHSGTGTRFIPPPMVRAARSGFLLASSQSIDPVASRRYRELKRSARSTTKSEGISPLSTEQIDQQTVLARFAPPPAEIQAAVTDATKNRSIRAALQRQTSRSANDLNHTLWAGCRDDQTSADAYINQDYHGAFSYYFCKAIRDLGAQVDVKDVAKAVRTGLRDDNFTQVPQLEPASASGVTFGTKKKSSPNKSENDGPKTDGPNFDGADPGASLPVLDTADLKQLIDLLNRIVGQAEASSPAARSQDHGKRAIVYLHGICEHSQGYSNAWWNSLATHLDDPLRSELAACRKEVLWSQHVSSTSRAVAADTDPQELAQLQSMMQAVLEERVTREASEQIAESHDGRSPEDPIRQPVSRALLGVPGLDCVDDFMKYLANDKIRERVIGEATRVLGPLLAEGRSVELFSHSWGTVVAYEALHRLSGDAYAGRIHNWFTIGSALAISFVAKRLRPSHGDKPSLVENWINLDAKGDAVGGSVLATGMKVDREYLRLNPVGCNAILGIFSPACAHSSYFHQDNHQVNRKIFAKWLQAT